MMRDGISRLSDEEIAEIESYLHLPLIAISNGLTQPMTLADDCLNLVESLWATQALKERQFDAWFNLLRDQHAAQVTGVVANGNEVVIFISFYLFILFYLLLSCE
jgi:hypothetical protein